MQIVTWFCSIKYSLGKATEHALLETLQISKKNSLMFVIIHIFI
jgi:hypothetical protein